MEAPAVTAALAANQRLIRLTRGNVKNGHIPTRSLRDFLPATRQH